MGRKDKNKNKGKGAVKTAIKTEKNQAAKHRKQFKDLGEADISDVVARLEEEQKQLVGVAEEDCSAPTPRSYFSLVAHPEKEELILFGGELNNGAKVTVYNNLYFYNIRKQSWKELKSPNGPIARSGHQMVALLMDGGQLWLFGEGFTTLNGPCGI